MFWRKHVNGQEVFLAITEIVDVSKGTSVQGERTFRFRLFDGSFECKTMSARDWCAWQASMDKGGVVVNGDRD